MLYDFYAGKNDFGSVIAASFAFHALIIIALVLTVWLGPKKEPPPPIPFFELINVASPPPAPPAPVERKPEPVPEQPIPEPAPEPTPQVKPELKPEIKEKKPEPKPEKKPETARPVSEPVAEPTPVKESMPMDMPAMDMPKDTRRDMNMPALAAVGNVIMDQQMQDYFKRLISLIYQNFNPPSGTEITSGTKSTVYFKIERNGEISEVVLRSSSGNAIWDRLAVRAVQITKPPPLPSSYTAEDLPLKFDFREK